MIRKFGRTAIQSKQPIIKEPFGNTGKLNNITTLGAGLRGNLIPALFLEEGSMKEIVIRTGTDLREPISSKGESIRRHGTSYNTDISL